MGVFALVACSTMACSTTASVAKGRVAVMPADKAITHRMADKHEADLAETFGGRRTRGSGNQWNGQLDVRMDRSPLALGFDGKATQHASVTVSRNMWAKLVQQASDLRPAMPLRFYEPDGRLRVALDLIVLDLNDFYEIYEKARCHDGSQDHA